MSITRTYPTRTDQLEVMGNIKWDETPPTFSWSMDRLPKIGIGSDGSLLRENRYFYPAKLNFTHPYAAPDQTLTFLPSRPQGVHYQINDTGSITSRFLSSIFQPIATFFPNSYQDPPPPPTPLSISTPSSTLALEELENGIIQGIKSIRWILTEHKKLKQHAPYLQLSSRAAVSLFERLLAVKMYKQFLQVIEMEDLVAVEGADLVSLSLEQFDEDKKKEVLAELYQVCSKEHRDRFRGMLQELDIQAQKALHKAVLRETELMLSQIMGKTAEKPTEPTFAKAVAMATDAEMLCTIVDRIIATKTKIGVETSQAIFQRFIDLGCLDDSVKYALNPEINVPETNNAAKICTAFCEKTRYREAYNLIMAALEVKKFGFLSDADIRVGVRTVDSSGQETEEELVALWEALNKSNAISVRDIRKETFQALIGRACRLKFGRKSQWWEGDGATPLLKMCIEIIVLRLHGEVKVEHLSTLLETWVWNWQGDEAARVDTHSLDGSIPFLPSLLDILTPEQLDEVFRITIFRVIANCKRMGNEIWPLRVLWPLVASVARNRRLWTDEESVALWILEGLLLRKGLAHKYLAFRTDAEIARFVVRHYLPFRLALESKDESEKEKAKNVFFKLRAMEDAEPDPDIRAGVEKGIEVAIDTDPGPFATAILAFKGTGIPCRTLLLDMVYTLHRLGRPVEVINMLRSLSPNAIRPSSSQYSRLIRVFTPKYPEIALAMLKLYAKSQYSTFASYIVTVAHKHPHLAIDAYRFLTRPSTFPPTPDQPQASPRRLPKRRLLVAMAWKFANSPVLTARQCHRWVHKCYCTMLRLGYAPGPTVGLAFAVAAVQRTIREGIPVRVGSARQKWVLQTVKRQAGIKKAKEVENILKDYEAKRKERAQDRSLKW